MCEPVANRSHDSQPGSAPRGDQMVDQLSDRLKHFQSISDNWFQFIDDFLEQFLDSKFESLSALMAENNHLMEALQTRHSHELNEIIGSVDDNITTETDLNNHLLDLKTSVETLSSQLSDKKSHKTDLTNKTKSLMKKVEEMENRVKDLKQQNHSNDSNEYMVLASVMRVMYKTWNNSQVVGLLFNDNEEKSLEKLIVMDNEKKCEKTMSQQFWRSLNTDYQLDD